MMHIKVINHVATNNGTYRIHRGDTGGPPGNPPGDGPPVNPPGDGPPGNPPGDGPPGNPPGDGPPCDPPGDGPPGNPPGDGPPCDPPGDGPPEDLEKLLKSYRNHSTAKCMTIMTRVSIAML